MGGFFFLASGGSYHYNFEGLPVSSSWANLAAFSTICDFSPHLIANIRFIGRLSIISVLILKFDILQSEE